MQCEPVQTSHGRHRSILLQQGRKIAPLQVVIVATCSLITSYLYLLRGLGEGYLLTSNASTQTKKSFGKATAKEIKAANSPLWGSASTIGANSLRHFNDNAVIFLGWPSFLGGRSTFGSSLTSMKDVTYPCTGIPFRGTLNSFPARVLVVPSKPPVPNVKNVYIFGHDGLIAIILLLKVNLNFLV